MSTFAAIILGILIGWLIEWVIDWIYWRRRESALRAENARLDDQLHSSRANTLDLQKQLAALKASIRLAQPQPYSREADQEEIDAPARAAGIPASPAAPAGFGEPWDDLEIIKGIGPVIARKLNDAGITTFAALGALTPAGLREIVGDAIQRLADEDSIIQQANELARRKQQGD